MSWPSTAPAYENCLALLHAWLVLLAGEAWLSFLACLVLLPVLVGLLAWLTRFSCLPKFGPVAYGRDAPLTVASSTDPPAGGGYLGRRSRQKVK